MVSFEGSVGYLFVSYVGYLFEGSADVFTYVFVLSLRAHVC